MSQGEGSYPHRFKGTKVPTLKINQKPLFQKVASLTIFKNLCFNLQRTSIPNVGLKIFEGFKKRLNI